MTNGLDGIVAASTRISNVDGEAGRLTLAGYAIEELAPHASFEEVAYLLLHGQLPAPAAAPHVQPGTGGTPRLVRRRARRAARRGCRRGRRRWTPCAWPRRS